MANRHQYRKYKCRNPHYNPECRRITEAEKGSEREKESLCPECHDQYLKQQWKN